MYSGTEQTERPPEPEKWPCGASVPGAPFGRPGTVECQGDVFTLVEEPSGGLVSHCVVCRSAEALPVRPFAAGAEDPVERLDEVQNGQAPALPPIPGAPPGLLVCGHRTGQDAAGRPVGCPGIRFSLIEVGNELRTRCEACKTTERIGIVVLGS